MGRRSYSGEKRRKELQRKAKRDAKHERKQQEKGEGDAGSGPPIDWDAQVGGPNLPNLPPDQPGEAEAGPEPRP
jgi:hypothetical protein